MVHLHKWNTQCIRTSERRPLALFASISSEGCCRASDKKQRGGFAILTSEHQALAVATQEMQGGTTGIFVFFFRQFLPSGQTQRKQNWRHFGEDQIEPTFFLWFYLHFTPRKWWHPTHRGPLHHQKFKKPGPNPKKLKKKCEPCEHQQEMTT